LQKIKSEQVKLVWMRPYMNDSKYNSNLDIIFRLEKYIFSDEHEILL